jgi:hypothetical protein
VFEVNLPVTFRKPLWVPFSLAMSKTSYSWDPQPCPKRRRYRHLAHRAKTEKQYMTFLTWIIMTIFITCYLVFLCWYTVFLQDLRLEGKEKWFGTALDLKGLRELVRYVKARCYGDSLQAGKSRWQVDYRVSDLQQDCKVARFWTRGRAIRVSE